MTVVLLALAVFRLTRLITVDEWPPTKALREWTVERTGEESGWSYLVECPWCVSMYVGPLVVAATLTAGVSVAQPVLVALTTSAATGLIARNLD